MLTRPSEWTPRNGRNIHNAEETASAMVRSSELIGSNDYESSRRTKEPALVESRKPDSIVLVLANGRQVCCLGVCVIQKQKSRWSSIALFDTTSAFGSCSQMAGEWLISARDGDPARVQKFFQASARPRVFSSRRIRTCPPSTIGCVCCICR